MKIDINDSPIKWEKKISRIESDTLNNKKAGKKCKLIEIINKRLVCIDKKGKITKRKI